MMNVSRILKTIAGVILFGLAAVAGTPVLAQTDHERIVELERLVTEQTAQIAALGNVTSPIGTIAAFAGPVDRIPSDWMLCDGRALNKNNEPKLFNRIGTAWGGNGNPDFKLPDLRGRFIRGADGGAGLDPDLADRVVQDPSCTAAMMGICKNTSGSLQSDATRRPDKNFETDVTGAHNHLSDGRFDRALLFDGHETIHETDDIGGGQEPNLKDSKPIVNAGDHRHFIVAGGDRETRPKNAYVLWIIRVR
jgi:microcystin-dependent protein